MGTITLRNIDDDLKASLRLQAAAHGRSMEEEARQILRQSLLRQKSSVGIGTRISKRFSTAGGIDLHGPSRSKPRQASLFEDE